MSREYIIKFIALIVALVSVVYLVWSMGGTWLQAAAAWMLWSATVEICGVNNGGN